MSTAAPALSAEPSPGPTVEELLVEELAGLDPGGENPTWAASNNHPFVGLRPFDYCDHEWFFGRTAHSRALYRMVDRNRFIAVVGSSGSGKSSLVRAGLRPLLEEETRDSTDNRWLWAEFRPGSAPITRLASAIAKLYPVPASVTDRTSHILARADRIAFTLRQSSLGLVQVLNELSLLGRGRVLLLVDQFEELFRYASLRQSGRNDPLLEAERLDEAMSFVQLLLVASQDRDIPLRVVITIRSDFIGECGRYLGLGEAVSAAQFLVPRLKRDELEATIRMPVVQAGAEIQNSLVQRLIGDAGTDLDQLPVLQHVLMRTWHHAKARRSQETPDAGPETKLNLTYEDYDAIGRFSAALSIHANQLYDDLTRGDREIERVIAEVFRALTTSDHEGRAIRRPLSFGRLLRIVTPERASEGESAASERHLRRVLDAFRARYCSFLYPPEDRPLTTNQVIDISHEALIRHWDRLCRPSAEGGWLQTESRDGERYRALLQMLPNPLDPAATPEWQKWWNRRRPTSGWAELYGGQLDKVEDLLDRSVQNAAEAQTKRRNQEKERKRFRQVIGMFIVLLAVVAVGAFGLYRVYELWKTSDRAIAALAKADLELLKANGLSAKDLPTKSSDHMETDQLVAAIRSQTTKLITGSLAQRAEQAIAQDGPTTSILLALNSLKKQAQFAYVPQAEATVYAALLQLREERIIHLGSVSGLSTLGPTGMQFAGMGADEQFHLWDLDTGKDLFIFSRMAAKDGTGEGEPWSVDSAIKVASFSPDGALVFTTSSDDEIASWSTSTGKQVASAHQKGVGYALAVSDDGKTIAVSTDTGVQIRRASDLALSRSLLVSSDVNVLGFATGLKASKGSGGQDQSEPASTPLLIAGMEDGAVVLFGLSSDSATRRIDTASLAGESRAGISIYGGLCLNSCRALVTADSEGTIITWDVERNQPFSILRLEGSALGLAISPDHSLMATGSAKGEAKIIDRFSNSVKLRLVGEQEFVAVIGFSPDGTHVVTISDDNTARAWNVGRPALAPWGISNHFEKKRGTCEISSTSPQTDGEIHAIDDPQLESWGHTATMDPTGIVPTVRISGGDETVEFDEITLALPPAYAATKAVFGNQGKRVVLVPRCGPLLLYRLDKPDAPIAKFGSDDSSWTSVKYQENYGELLSKQNRKFQVDAAVAEHDDGSSEAWPIFKTTEDIAAFAEDSLPRVGESEPIVLSQVRQCAYQLLSTEECQKSGGDAPKN
jgi:WD40 repeat protein/energy-coupling factor transporter ATP-binding protein EcfA2